MKLCIFAASFILGWVGWWLGSQFGGEMTAYFSSGAGSLVGVYVGWRVYRNYME